MSSVSLKGLDYKGKIGINGRFLTQRTIGEGASCKVKLGLDSEVEGPEGYRKVAIKMLAPNKMKYMKNELDNYAKMSDHPNVVSLIEHGECVY